MFSNREPITVDAFNQPMVTQVLDSAPDAVGNAADYQKNVLAIAEYVGMNEINRAAIDAIIKGKALPYLLSLATGEVRGDARGGWVSTREWLAFGDDVEFRCSCNYAGIWWNSSAEVVYYMGFKDESGVVLNGDNIYAIHYQLEDLPIKHVKAYWSLTLMSLPDFRVVPNELERFNLNNISDLVYGEDGSLTLYLASESPPDVPAANWLPAPKGRPFVVNHRLYAPKEEVLSGEWYAPPIEKTKQHK
jgi:hypothetical protein